MKEPQAIDKEIMEAVPILDGSDTNTVAWIWYRAIATHFLEKGRAEGEKKHYAKGAWGSVAWLRAYGFFEAANALEKKLPELRVKRP